MVFLFLSVIKAFWYFEEIQYLIKSSKYDFYNNLQMCQKPEKEHSFLT